MKKFFKLLCYSLITVFLLGLGGEKAFAEDLQTFTAKEGAHWIDLYNPRWWSSVKTRADNGDFVFCLDSEKYIYTEGTMSLISSPGTFARSYESGYEENIKAIMTRAYRLGYGDKSKSSYTFTIEGSQYTISSTDFYGIIQAAIWKAAHGSGNDGYLPKYEKWIGDKKYDSIFEYLTRNNDYSYYLTFDYVPAQGDPFRGEFNLDGETWVSGQYKLNSNMPSTTTFQISVSNGGSIQVKNGDSWVSSDAPSLHIGDIIRIVRPKQDSDSGQLISAKLDITSSDVITGTTLYKYHPTGHNEANSRNQNLVLPKPEFGHLTASVTVNGTYTSNGQLRVAKITKINGVDTPIAGARMKVYLRGHENEFSQEFTSTNDYISFNNVPASTSSSTKVYCLKELKAPDGYIRNNTEVCGTLNESSSLSLTVENNPQRLQFRKTDMQGNPIAGVRLEIHGYVDETLAGKDDYPYFCGITDEQGYLTRPCTDVGDNSGTTARIVNPVNGTFPISLDEHLDGIYYIKEYFKEGFYNPSLDDDWMDFGIFHRKENSADFDEETYGLQYAGRKATTYLQFSGKIGEDPVVTVNILNSRYVKFTKTDTGTGNEIPGAEMILEDLNVEDYSIGAPLARRVDEWISDGTPHYFTEAMIGHKYRLKETVAPAEHVKLETTIEFTIDENGKVVLAEGTPTQVKLSDDPNIDLDRWIIVGNDMVVNPPNTGISLLNKIAVGCLLVFVGYEVIKIYRKKANS